MTEVFKTEFRRKIMELLIPTKENDKLRKQSCQRNQQIFVRVAPQAMRTAGCRRDAARLASDQRQRAGTRIVLYE